MLSLILNILICVAHASPIRVALIQRPPYGFKDLQGRPQGIEVELMKVLFPRRDVQFIFVSNARAAKELENRTVDVATIYVDPSPSIYTSHETYLVFHNRVFIKKKKNYQIRSAADLRGLTIATYQGAEKVNGFEFQNLLKTPGSKPIRLIENRLQRVSHLMFWKDRVDALLADMKIFNWYKKELAKEANTNDEVQIYNVLKSSVAFHANFTDPMLRDEFDHSLATLKITGEYQRIIDSFSAEELDTPYR